MEIVLQRLAAICAVGLTADTQLPGHTLQLQLIEALAHLINTLVELLPEARSAFASNNGFGVLIVMLHSLELRSSAAALIHTLALLLADREPLLIALIGLLRRFRGANLVPARPCDPVTSGRTVSLETCLCAVQCLANILRAETKCKQVFAREHGDEVSVSCVQEAMVLAREAPLLAEQAIGCICGLLSLLTVVAAGDDAVAFPSERLGKACMEAAIFDAPAAVRQQIIGSLLVLALGRLHVPSSPPGVNAGNLSFISAVTEDMSAILLGNLSADVTETLLAPPGQSGPILLRPYLVNVVVCLAGSLASGPAQHFGMANEILEDLIRLLEDGPCNSSLMARHGVLRSLVVTFAHVFRQEDHPCQKMLARLLVILARSQLTGGDLRLLLGYMNHGWYSHHLLQTLLAVAKQSKHAPAHYLGLAYPTTLQHDMTRSSGADAAVSCRLNDLRWPPANGFSIMFWFRTSDLLNHFAPEDDVRVLPLYTMHLEPETGSNPAEQDYELLLVPDEDELALRPPTLAICLDSGSRSMMVQCVVRGAMGECVPHTFRLKQWEFAPNEWYHVALTWGPAVESGVRLDSGGDGGFTQRSLTLLVDGGLRDTSPADGVELALSFGSYRVNVYAGDPSALHWQLGNVTVFDMPLSAERVMRIFALGPNVAGFRDGLESPPELISEELLAPAKDPLAVLHALTDPLPLSVLEERVVLHLRASDACIFQAHRMHEKSLDASTSTGVACTNGVSVPMDEVTEDASFTTNTISALAASAAALATGLQLLPRTLSQHMVLCRRQYIWQALQEVGGLSVLLYMLSQAPPIEKYQVTILRLIFAALRFNPALTASMLVLDGYRLLAAFLRSKRCILGHDMLAALLHGACGRDAVLSECRGLILQNHHIFKHIFLDDSIWQQAPLHVWESLTAM